MQDRRTAPIRLSVKDLRLSVPPQADSASAPTTPNTAASVAVAKPK